MDVLGLSAVPVRGYDGAPGHLVGDGAAVVAPHDVQAEVEPGGDPGGGQDIAVVDEQDVRVDPHGGEQALEMPGRRPVRGRGAAVEVARGSQDVPAGADGDHAGAGAYEGEGGLEVLGQHALLVDRAELVRRGDHDGVGGGQGLGAELDGDGEVGVRTDRARRPDGTRHDLVEGFARRVLRTAEDAVRDTEFEGEQPVEREDDHAVRHGAVLPVHRPRLLTVPNWLAGIDL
ncbi:hypothetical protein AS594_19745 [Streptomyces agglomeratus]|uniref:Uncharacterized protein n=1 Tax=Streptomyces agglomeratus TaxID=285458 RepID=A0A1E5PA38_9ACTN|nr:hypothetical protein AS594_19745 [Streptomyces agglomeratus]